MKAAHPPFRSLCLFAALLAQACVLHGAPQQPPGEHVRSGTPPEECEVYCSQLKLRTPGARLTFPSAAKGVARERLRLDWTVHKKGFAQGAFGSFVKLERGEVSRLPVAASAQPAQGRDEGPKLTLMDVQHSRDGRLVLAVEGLEPGLNYRWRLMVRKDGAWVAVAETVCQAPVCPADLIDERSEPRKVGEP